MKKGDKTSTENGVKRPSQIKDIVIPSQSDAWGDSLLMLSLMFGMAAILLKYRFLSWLSLCSAVVSLGNMRVVDMDFKNLMTSFTVCLMSLLFAYVGPNSAYFV